MYIFYRNSWKELSTSERFFKTIYKLLWIAKKPETGKRLNFAPRIKIFSQIRDKLGTKTYENS